MEELAPALSPAVGAQSQPATGSAGSPRAACWCCFPTPERIRCHPFSDYSTYLSTSLRPTSAWWRSSPASTPMPKVPSAGWSSATSGWPACSAPPAPTPSAWRRASSPLCPGHRQWVEHGGAACWRIPAAPVPWRCGPSARAQELVRSPSSGGLLDAVDPANGRTASAQPALQRRKLLVLNVYFAPQSVGGATRVAQDQVRALQAQRGDQWEVTVLCTDSEPWQCGSGSPLIQSSPARSGRSTAVADADAPVEGRVWCAWRCRPAPGAEHHDLSVEAFCRRWFPQEGFDLVHAHCIQVLGIGPLTRGQRAGHSLRRDAPRRLVAVAAPVPAHHPQWQAGGCQDPLGHHDVADRLSPEQLQQRPPAAAELEQVLAGAAAGWRCRRPLPICMSRPASGCVGDGEPLAADAGPATHAGDRLINRCAAVSSAAWRIHKGMHVVQAAVSAGQARGSLA